MAWVNPIPFTMGYLGKLAGPLLDFCYPGVCACCEAACDGAGPLCEECQGKLRALEAEAACDRCAMPLVQAGAPCPYCLGKGVYPYQRIVRLGRFVEPLKPLIHQMKYNRRWPLGEFLADRLLLQERVRAMLGEGDRVVAVPLHWWRQVRRGYNQAEVIAARLARRRGRVAHPVVRLRNTETQTALHSHAQRLQNLRGAFGLVRGGAIRGKHVIVVDDVMTTAATLRSVGRVLREGEPASLSAIVVAIADRRHRDFQVI